MDIKQSVDRLQELQLIRDKLIRDLEETNYLVQGYENSINNYNAEVEKQKGDQDEV